MSALSWRHHALIQALLSRGPMKEDAVRSIFSQVTGKSIGASAQKQQEHSFNEYIKRINVEFRYVQLELRACRNQYDGNVFYGVVNNVSDDQSKLGTKYTAPQLAFYKSIVEAIIQDAEAKGSISNIDALHAQLESQIHGVTESQSEGDSVHIPLALKNFSMSQKEKTLEHFVKDQFLCSTSDGKIGLGLRSFLDLRSWFRSNDVPACEVCNEAAVKAELCPNEGCNVRLHEYCLKKKFFHQRIAKVCPGCGVQWPGSLIKPESIEEEDGGHVPSQNPHPSVRKGQGSKRKADSVATGSDSAAVPSAKTRMTRRSTRLSASWNLLTLK